MEIYCPWNFLMLNLFTFDDMCEEIATRNVVLMKKNISNFILYNQWIDEWILINSGNYHESKVTQSMQYYKEIFERSWKIGIMPCIPKLRHAFLILH